MPIEFGANNRFNSRSGRGLSEFDSAMEIVFVSEGDGGEIVAFGEVNDGVDGQGRVEEGVVAVDVEGDE